MRFRVLGPVEIEVDEAVLPLPRRRERCLLGVLLLAPGQVVPIDRLARLLWDGEPPERARRIIHSHVSRIRALLSSAGGERHGVRLAFVGGGYRLTVDPEAVDAHRFRTLVDRAAKVATPTGRVEQLRQALDLWRGPVLADAATDWLRERLCVDLNELRLTATEELLAESLALNRHRTVLPELARLTRLHPGRERLVELHMRALYETGRRAEALDVFARVRDYLAGELGLDPGAALQDLHQAILNDQAPPPVAVPEPNGAGQVDHPVSKDLAAHRVAPRQLPTDVPGFTGREVYRDRLDVLARKSADPANGVVIAAICGTAGVGKTALAVHWAHRVADRFPDGQLYVNLRGFDPTGPPMDPSEAVQGFLDALHVPAERIPAGLDAQVGLYRSVIAGRRILILLDNARNAEQVRPLLPGTSGSLVVVTSRSELAGLVAAESAHLLTLPLLNSGEARRMLERRLGTSRLATEPEATEEIITRCSGLPLALAIASARAASRPSFPLAALAAELGREPGVDAFAGHDASTDIRTVFSCSYRALRPAAARLFRTLGLHPGPDVSVPAAASLAGISTTHARRLLAELAGAHLFTEHSPGRYVGHDLLTAYARELAHACDTEQDRREATHRLLDYYLRSAHTAAVLLNPYRDPITLSPAGSGVTGEHIANPADALTWLTAEYSVLLAAARQAGRIGFHTHAWQLAWTLRTFQERRGHWTEMDRLHRVALSAARRAGDLVGQAQSYRGLAGAHLRLGRLDEARASLARALDLFRNLDDRPGQARTHLTIGYIVGLTGENGAALWHAEQALDLFRATGDEDGQASALNDMGWYHVQLGHHRDALEHCQRALAIRRRRAAGATQGEAHTLDSLGYIYHQRGDHQRALDCYRQALTIFRDLGDRFHEAETLTHCGDAHAAAGDPDGAQSAWRRALDILQDLGHRNADAVRARLGGRRAGRPVRSPVR